MNNTMQQTLCFGSLVCSDMFDMVPGVSAMFLGVEHGNVVCSVGGFVLRLNKYDYGQRRRCCFVLAGQRYYAQGHHRESSDDTLTMIIFICRADAGRRQSSLRSTSINGTTTIMLTTRRKWTMLCAAIQLNPIQPTHNERYHREPIKHGITC